MENNQHELVFKEKTFTLSKLTPSLKGKVIQMQAQYRMGLKAISSNLSEADLATAIENDPDVQLFMFGLMVELIPPLIWEFFSPQDKQAVGTKENFLENLDQAETIKFQDWLTAQSKRTQDFLASTEAQSPVSPPLSEQSTQPSPEATDGQTQTAQG